MELLHVDVTTAFLNGSLNEEVYMRQPEGYSEKSKEDFVCYLSKSIYTWTEASLEFYPQQAAYKDESKV